MDPFAKRKMPSMGLLLSEDGQWARKRYHESLSQYDELTQNILDPVY